MLSRVHSPGRAVNRQQTPRFIRRTGPRVISAGLLASEKPPEPQCEKTMLLWAGMGSSRSVLCTGWPVSRVSINIPSAPLTSPSQATGIPSSPSSDAARQTLPIRCG